MENKLWSQWQWQPTVRCMQHKNNFTDLRCQLWVTYFSCSIIGNAIEAVVVVKTKYEFHFSYSRPASSGYILHTKSYVRTTENEIIPTGLFAKRNTSCIHFYISSGHFSAQRRRNMKKFSVYFVRFANVKYVVHDVFELKAQVLRFHRLFDFFLPRCVSFADIFAFLDYEKDFCSGTKVDGNAIRFSVDIVTVIVAVVYVNSFIRHYISMLSQRIQFRTTVNRNEVIRRCARHRNATGNISYLSYRLRSVL